ncbi:MAG: ECF transporter S component, partial [Zestosphaera sp.]
MRARFTSIDLALLAVAGVISGVVFTATWTIYNISEVVVGPVGARVISYGLWFIGAPLAASLLKKPSSALLGEFLGSLVETLIAPAGGITNAIYGFTQGLASELGYLIFRYRRWDMLSGALAGALAGIPAVSLDALLFGLIGGPAEM